MRKFVLGALALFVATTLALPAVAGSKFWVENHTGHEIYHVYAKDDSSGGQRDLLGENGIIPAYDKALTLKPRGSSCYSDVAVVNENDQWIWFDDVYICSQQTTLNVSYF